MKYIDEYRSAEAAGKLADEIARITTRPHTIMEVCGGQTHAIMKFGINKLLPDELNLLHGPGCPVCVTPVELIDKAVEIVADRDVIFCSFGDMLRVPGTGKDLLSVKAEGGDVRIVYSPLDALKVASDNPNKQVVFFAVGFETTAPANALAVYQAKLQNLNNFSLLVSQVLIPPAIEAILDSPNCRVEGLLAPGHVCAVTGYEEYERISRQYNLPIVVTGFEPLDILSGILMCLKRLEEGTALAENQYIRAVRREGNKSALQMMYEVFQVVPRKWRGIGEIHNSGLGLKDEYADFDAEIRFGRAAADADDDAECISGLILQGVKKPDQCPAFGKACTPERPLGATMVSSEGACAAYYRYRPKTDDREP
ncbi:MAG: hydrogenase formation protein HypD [candidate division Zixibacteria bacterium]|nr:hydrogenase formation protein HypD [Candidatus Tariuqbacter arcticus]